MNDNDSISLEAFANRLADESRAILGKAAGIRPGVELKKDNSYVTSTDRSIEERLREIITETYPDHGIFGEEFGNHNLDAEYVWVLDPIDGTAAFVAGIPVFGTLIGLARDKKPYLGVIDHPMTDDRWNGVAGVRSSHNGKPIQTRACPKLADALATCCNPDPLTDDELARFGHLRKSIRYVQYGGSCYSYGVLASGRTDLAVDSGLDVFDVLAPIAVITGAGGIATDWDGREIDLNWQGQIIAAGDTHCHQRALDMLMPQSDATPASLEARGKDSLYKSGS